MHESDEQRAGEGADVGVAHADVPVVRDVDSGLELRSDDGLPGVVARPAAADSVEEACRFDGSDSSHGNARPVGPVSADTAASQEVPHPASAHLCDATRPSDGAPVAPWEAPRPLPAEPGQPKRGLAAVGHFLAWGVFAVFGVLVAVFGIQLVVATIGATALVLRDGLSSSGAISTDSLVVITAASQVVMLAVFVPWWRHVRKRGIAVAERSRGVLASHRRWMRLVLTALAIVLLGVGLQIVMSMLLGLILPLFPEVEQAYEAMMEDAGMNDFSLLPVLSVAVLAPLSEELAVRGVAFQFALRAVSPAWRGGLAPEAYRKLAIPAQRFWVAAALQALAFGILHFNITQGVYAFASGLVFAWLFGRTGRLRYGVGLHLVVNFSSYFVADIVNASGVLGLFGQIAFPVLCLVVGARLFLSAAPADGCLCSREGMGARAEAGEA